MDSACPGRRQRAASCRADCSSARDVGQYCAASRPRNFPRLHQLLPGLTLALVLLVAPLQPASSQGIKWTVMIYMLADNNLECFGILDLLEMMQGMYKEPTGSCTDSACGQDCPGGYVVTQRTNCGAGQVKSRCCPAAFYPDVVVLADRGVSACTYDDSGPYDYSLFQQTWSTARELTVLPGGVFQQERDYGEIDMASPDQLAAFLKRVYTRFPPDGSRKYMLVLWDHGNGWKGYGVDDVCTAGGSASPLGCDQFTMATLAQGLQTGLEGKSLDIIGFDACLMSMFEIGVALAPYAQNLLGSELLEPGHGWDYAALGTMIQTPNGLNDATELAKVWIARYKAQALAYQTTGITLALTDLRSTWGVLQGAIADLATTFSAGLQEPAYSSVLLRRRALMADMGSGEQEASVDLGSMLSEFAAAPDLGSDAKAKVAAAQSAYVSAVKTFDRDDELAKGTGVAIFFPIMKTRLDSDYFTFAALPSVASSVGPWASFLSKLFNVSGSFSSGQPFNFLSTPGVSAPYLDVASGAFMLSGTLNSPLALSAQAYYGLKDPTDSFYILAGAQPAVIDNTQVTGQWRRLLWGVSQTLVAPDGSRVSRAALMFASEDWTITGSGTVVSVSLTANVKYGATCSTNRASLQNGVLKYTYFFGPNRMSLQLFVQQQGGGPYGELNSQAGGVVVPLMYKLPIDFSGFQKSTYMLSSCLKWGYNNSIKVIAVGVAASADGLGVDLDEDMLMFLQARDISMTRSAVLLGSFNQEFHTTAGGCQCLMQWKNQGDNTTIYRGCANPDNDPGGPWCPIQPGSCGQPAKALGAWNASASPWDFCRPQTTLSGCSCSNAYGTDAANSTIMYGRCYDGDTRAGYRGSWCTVNATTCPSPARAHGENDTSYDHCQIKTVEGCFCMNSWTYSGETYFGTCRTGFVAGGTPPDLTNGTRWCMVDPGCQTFNQVNGQKIGLCTPMTPRLAGPAQLPCQYPAKLNGVPFEDCISWRNGNFPTDRREGLAPWCFINTATGLTGNCTIRSCTELDLSACPTTMPAVTNLLPFSAYMSKACLDQLCVAYELRNDASTCGDDGLQAGDMWSQLSGSQPFLEQLAVNYTGVSSLEAYCNQGPGRDCLVWDILPACPGLELLSDRAYNTVHVSPAPQLSDLCKPSCLKALCQVQSLNCTRDRLVERTRLALMEAMDVLCNATFAKPVLLMCAELLAPPQTCERRTALADASGTILLKPDNTTKRYSPLSNCSWVISNASLPFVRLFFTAFTTEPVYDTLTVEDAEGVLAVFSGADIPDAVFTDTGYMKLTFVSDSSIQLNGFTAIYTAAATRNIVLPSCDNRDKLMMLTLRTQQYADEVSWAIVAYRIVASTDTNTTMVAATQQSMLASGGQLPTSIYAYFTYNPSLTVVTDKTYKEYRSYTSYACLPAGVYTLYMYDAYGDGWDGGSIAVQYLRNASASYPLLNTTTKGFNASQTFHLFTDMPANQTEYEAALAANKNGGIISVRATLRLPGTTSDMSQAKLYILRSALAAVMTLDVSVVAAQLGVVSGRRSLLMAAAPEPDAGAWLGAAGGAHGGDGSGYHQLRQGVDEDGEMWYGHYYDGYEYDDDDDGIDDDGEVEQHRQQRHRQRDVEPDYLEFAEAGAGQGAEGQEARRASTLDAPGGLGASPGASKVAAFGDGGADAAAATAAATATAEASSSKELEDLLEVMRMPEDFHDDGDGSGIASGIGSGGRLARAWAALQARLADATDAAADGITHVAAADAATLWPGRAADENGNGSGAACADGGECPGEEVLADGTLMTGVLPALLRSMRALGLRPASPDANSGDAQSEAAGGMVVGRAADTVADTRSGFASNSFGAGSEIDPAALAAVALRVQQYQPLLLPPEGWDAPYQGPALLQAVGLAAGEQLPPERQQQHSYTLRDGSSRSLLNLVEALQAVRDLGVEGGELVGVAGAALQQPGVFVEEFKRRNHDGEDEEGSSGSSSAEQQQGDALPGEVDLSGGSSSANKGSSSSSSGGSSSSGNSVGLGSIANKDSSSDGSEQALHVLWNAVVVDATGSAVAIKGTATSAGDQGRVRLMEQQQQDQQQQRRLWSRFSGSTTAAPPALHAVTQLVDEMHAAVASATSQEPLTAVADQENLVAAAGEAVTGEAGGKAPALATAPVEEVSVTTPTTTAATTAAAVWAGPEAAAAVEATDSPDTGAPAVTLAPRSANGGRTPVVNLHQLLPELLPALSNLRIVTPGQDLASAVNGADVIRRAAREVEGGADGRVVDGPAGQERRRRRRVRARSLQQQQQSTTTPSEAPAGSVDVTIAVLGYDTNDAAVTAVARLQSVVRTGTLQSTLEDAGWSDANITFSVAPVIINGDAEAQADDGSKTNWLKLGLIIGASVGGGLLAFLIVMLIIYMVQRKKRLQKQRELEKQGLAGGASASAGKGGVAGKGAGGKGIDSKPGSAGSDSTRGSSTPGTAAGGSFRSNRVHPGPAGAAGAGPNNPNDMRRHSAWQAQAQAPMPAANSSRYEPVQELGHQPPAGALSPHGAASPPAGGPRQHAALPPTAARGPGNGQRAQAAPGGQQYAAPPPGTDPYAAPYDPYVYGADPYDPYGQYGGYGPDMYGGAGGYGPGAVPAPYSAPPAGGRQGPTGGAGTPQPPQHGQVLRLSDNGAQRAQGRSGHNTPQPGPGRR